VIEAEAIVSHNGRGTLPDGWRWARLGEVCEERTGVRDPREEPNKLFRYVDITSVDNKAKRIVDAKTLLGKDAPSRARQVMRTADVIVSTTRPNLNAVALVPSELDDEVCSTGFCVLRPKSELNSNYLFAFVQSRDFVERLCKLVNGALYPSVTDKQLREQIISLPPLAEQARIAAILNDQMAAVERARAAASTQLQAAKALPAAHLRMIFNGSDTQMWPRRRLGEVCKFVGGTQPPKGTFKYSPQPGYVRLVQIQDFRRTDVPVYIPEEEASRRFETHDVMIGRYGPPVFQILRGLSGAYNVALMKTVPINGLLKEYLFYLLQEPTIQHAVITQSQRSAGQSGVQKTFLETLLVPIPSEPEQRRVVNHLDERIAAAEQTRKALEDQLTTINKVPAALLRRGFSGEL
jgi:type I restriction enzyme S subunit